MKKHSDPDCPQATSNLRRIQDALSKAPNWELYQFGYFLLVQVFQWYTFVRMCGTEGRVGTSSFILLMGTSLVFGLSLETLRKAHTITLISSALAMYLYFSYFGW